MSRGGPIDTAHAVMLGRLSVLVGVIFIPEGDTGACKNQWMHFVETSLRKNTERKTRELNDFQSRASKVGAFFIEKKLHTHLQAL